VGENAIYQCGDITGADNTIIQVSGRTAGACRGSRRVSTASIVKYHVQGNWIIL
jgi:hypothetical protein